MLHQSLIYHLQFKCKASKSVIVNAVTIVVSSGKKSLAAKTIKNINVHFVHYRGEFRTLSNIYDEPFLRK